MGAAPPTRAAFSEAEGELSPRAKVFAEEAPLLGTSIVRASLAPVEAVGHFREALVPESGDLLTIFQHEGYVVGAYLKHRRETLPALVYPESRVKEAGVVSP